MWGACALLVGGCSDDGVPLNEGDTDAGGTASLTAGGTSDGGPGTAVTTASPTSSTSSDSDTAATDPTGIGTDTGPDDTTDGTGTSGGETDGSSGEGSSTGGTPEPECVMDEDCMLVDDCCSCEAIPVGEDAPNCDIMECLVSTCTSLGLNLPAVQCNFGTCEVEAVSCDPWQVTCEGDDATPPTCPEGQLPRVVDGCWSDVCIPAEFCDVVPGCESCGENEACVEFSAQLGPSFTCVPTPRSCDGVPSCDCLGEACEDPFNACSDDVDAKSGSDLSCGCPAC